jgi:hypothetical protein
MSERSERIHEHSDPWIMRLLTIVRPQEVFA